MFTIHNGLGGHAAHVEWQPTKAMRLAALLGALAVASFAVNSLIVVADGTLRQRSPAAGDCQATCSDNPARQSAPQPARGANAPAHFRF
jgi:hypothetical protein